ncbi:unnamed protein product [Pieris macdunnoughi]|uniref:Uncharacterized protein n=1 Tax=Pieris macdunnoughi TaxID=345717 RepID=A0A821PAU0_9NEOP|nr:unnamed protein product [Pieris macdunnoughi]
MAAVGAVLLESRPFRPFKSSEEYLYAMKEDLAEWLTVLYPELRINADNFLDRLDTGVALCRTILCLDYLFLLLNEVNNWQEYDTFSPIPESNSHEAFRILSMATM